MLSTSSNAPRQIARAAGVIMLAFIVGNLAGLGRQILVARAFGTSLEIDAFNAANRVSETLFNLVAGGALGSAFIPTYTGLISHGKREEAWKLASAITNIVLAVTTMLAALIWQNATWIVESILAPGFVANSEQVALTVELLKLMLPSAVIFGLSGLVMGILNSHQSFLFPALAPALYQLGLIIGVLFLSPSMGVIGLAWGVILGSLLHLLIQIPTLLRLGGRYSPILDIKNPQVLEVARLMGPRLLGVAIVQINFWVNTRLASRFVEGSVTGLVLGFALMLMPQAAIAQSIAIAAMPTFSMQYALGKTSEMRQALASSLRGALILSIPASIGLIILRSPIVTLLYQRGEFTQRSTELVSWALLWFAAGLVGHALVEILSRAFYAMHDTRTPVLIGTGAMSLNILLSYFFSFVFSVINWMPHGGLALANSTATVLEAIVLGYLMYRRLAGLNVRYIISGVLRSVGASFIMSIVLGIWIVIAQHSPAWFLAVGGVFLGGIVFVGAAFLLRINELQSVFQLVRMKLTGK